MVRRNPSFRALLYLKAQAFPGPEYRRRPLRDILRTVEECAEAPLPPD
jgi:hypothetical protein